MIKNINKIYVLHVKKGYEERAEHIEILMKKHNLKFEYILDYDIPDLNEKDIQKYYDKNNDLDNPNLSVGMKHIQVLEQIVKNKVAITLVFEDDVFLDENFNKIVEKSMVELPNFEDPFVISLGNAANHYTKKKYLTKNKHLYKNKNHRAADSYILNLQAAKNRLEWFELNKTIETAGHMYNTIDNDVGNIIYWMEPPIVEQGSQNGLIESSIQQKKKFQRLRWLWRDFNKKYLRYIKYNK